MEAMDNLGSDGTTEADRCPWCGRREDEPAQVISRHMTSTGLITYARCRCGLLHVWHSRAPADRAAVLAQAARPAR
jgi:hypothetical protein